MAESCITYLGTMSTPRTISATGSRPLGANIGSENVLH